MHMRRDGESTRRKILGAASQVFGEKGYRDATHAEICSRAGVNTAAINYHFGSKDALYQAAWEHIADMVDQRCPVDGGLPPSAPAEDRLRGQIASLIDRATTEELASFHKIHMMESVNSTGLLDEAIANRRWHHRKHTLAALRDLLGPRATKEDVELCEMSVISQCRLVVRPPHNHHHRQPPWQIPSEDTQRLGDHITTFSLAGIKAVRREIEARK